MDQVAEGLRPGEVSQDLLREKLDRVVPGVEKAIKAAGIDASSKPLIPGPGRTDVRSRLPKQQTGFQFWASLEKSFPFFPSGRPAAIIKYLEVPDKGKGAGSAILRAWEGGMLAQGVPNFAATNIRDEQALKFWQKHGYRPQGAVKSGIPYCMVKTAAT